MVESVCAEFGCLPSEAASELRYYEPNARLMDDVRDARIMKSIHVQHVRSETMPAEQCAAAKEHLSKSYGETYSIYLIGWEAVVEYGR